MFMSCGVSWVHTQTFSSLPRFVKQLTTANNLFYINISMRSGATVELRVNTYVVLRSIHYSAPERICLLDHLEQFHLQTVRAPAARGICYYICISITFQALCLFIAAFARLCRWCFSTRKLCPRLVKTVRQNARIFISFGGSKIDEYSPGHLPLYFNGAIRKIYNSKRAKKLLECEQCCFDVCFNWTDRITITSGAVNRRYITYYILANVQLCVFHCGLLKLKRTSKCGKHSWIVHPLQPSFYFTW